MSIRKPFLRDGVDVYIRGENEVHFVYLATRKRSVLRVSPDLIPTLSWLDGEQTFEELAQRARNKYGERTAEQFSSFMEYLESKGIVIEREWQHQSRLDPITIETQQRQLNFLLDLLPDTSAVLAAQERIRNSHIVVFGVGAIGSWTLRLLLGLGFKQFTLVDYDHIEENDVARHAFVPGTAQELGQYKSEWLSELIEKEFPGTSARSFRSPLNIEASLHDLIGETADLVINSADEPYIGYTSVLLSRYCVPRKIPLLVTGGFDAHLASIGELIVPGVTPCADCYADYFNDSLANWRPVRHPVENRGNGFGGLSSLSVFSAGSAAMIVFRLVALGQYDAEGGRGELLFEDYRLERFGVARQPDCIHCGKA